MSETVTLSEILARTCKVFGVSPERVLSAAKRSTAAEARRVTLWVANELGLSQHNLSLAVGRSLGGIGQSIFLHRRKMAADPTLAAKCQALLAEFAGRQAIAPEAIAPSGAPAVAAEDMPSEEDYAPILADLSRVKSYAQQHGLVFRDWDDLRFVNRHRFQNDRREFARDMRRRA